MQNLLRQLHVYAGLILFPWAMLYGVSGWMFNHPDDADRAAELTAPVAHDSVPAFTASAPAGADSVIRALNAGASTQAPYYRVVHPKSARQFATIRFQVEEGDTVRTVTYTVGDPYARVEPLPLAQPRRSWVDRWVSLPLIALHKRVGYSTDVAGMDSGIGATLVRWGWASAVDLTVVAFLLWGISGLTMWWRYQKLRGWGGLAVVCSAIAAIVFGFAFHRYWSL